MGGSSGSREVKIAGRLWRRPSKSSVDLYRKEEEGQQRFPGVVGKAAKSFGREVVEGSRGVGVIE